MNSEADPNSIKEVAIVIEVRQLEAKEAANSGHDAKGINPRAFWSECWTISKVSVAKENQEGGILCNGVFVKNGVLRTKVCSVFVVMAYFVGCTFLRLNQKRGTEKGKQMQ